MVWRCWRCRRYVAVSLSRAPGVDEHRQATFSSMCSAARGSSGERLVAWHRLGCGFVQPAGRASSACAGGEAFADYARLPASSGREAQREAMADLCHFVGKQLAA